MRGLILFCLSVLFLMPDTSASGKQLVFAEDTVLANYRSILFLPKPDTLKYTFGAGELYKAAELYRAVEEAYIFKALADKYAVESDNKAVENYLKALTKLKNFKISKQYADLAFKLASVYQKQKKYDGAVKYFLKSSITFDSLGLKPEAGKSYIMLASVKFLQKNYKEAEFLILKKGLPLCAPSDNLSCYQLLARTYQDQNRFSESKWFYLQANTLSRKLNDTVGIITSLTGLGKVKTSIKAYTLAFQDLNEAELLAQGSDYSMYLTEIRSAKQNLQIKAPKLFVSNKNDLEEQQPATAILAVKPSEK